MRPSPWPALVLLASLLLAGCGGSTDSTALPATLSINAPAQAEVGSAVVLGSDLGTGRAGLSLSWDFGDGTGGSTQAQPTHVFAQPGSYEVSLTVRNDDGQSITTRTTVQAGRYTLVQDRVCSGPQSSGWCWQRPTPVGNPVNDVFFIDARNGWAVGEAGMVLKTSDGGLHWSLTRQMSGRGESLTQVAFADAMNGWALRQFVPGVETQLLHTTDGGGSWQPMPFAADPLSNTWNSQLTVVDAAKLVVFNNLTARASVDGGASWYTPLFIPDWVGASGTFWQRPERQGLLRSDDFGLSKTTLSLPTDGGLDIVDSAHLVSATLTHYDTTPRQGSVFHSSDGGRNWLDQPFILDGVGRNGGINAMRLSPQGSGLGLSKQFADAVQLARTGDWGATWTSVQTPVSAQPLLLYEDALLDPHTAYISSAREAYLTIDEGRTWRLLATPGESAQPAWPGGIALDERGALLLRYDSPAAYQRIYRSTDGGITLLPVSGGLAPEHDLTVSALWFTDAAQGLAYTSCGGVLLTQDGGRSWQGDMPDARFCGEDVPTEHLQLLPDGTGWARSGLLLIRSQDNGKTWVGAPGPWGSAEVESVHFVDAKKGWVRTGWMHTVPYPYRRVCYGSALYATEDGGASWILTPTPFSDGCGTLQRPWAGLAFAADARQALWRSVDDGKTWAHVPGVSVLSWPTARIRFIDALHGWILNPGGTLLRTVDGGLSWKAPDVAVDARFVLNDMRFIDAQRGWAVGNDGVVLATTDGGATWALQASGTANHLKSVFPVDIATVWIGGARGTILSTATGGR